MSQKVYQVQIRKEALKFAAAHMTVFPDGSKEALHGHNYQTEVTFLLNDASLERLIPFSIFKTAIRTICQEWDEKVLLPQLCPFLEVKSVTNVEIEFLLCKKRYVLPIEEVVLLKLDNITAENLSEEFCRRLIALIDPQLLKNQISGLQVKIEESPGQSSSFMWQASSETV